MNKYKIIILKIIIVLSMGLNAQVGIGISNPRGVIDINNEDGNNVMGIVLPKAEDINKLSTPEGEESVEGTLVYDKSAQCLRLKQQKEWSHCLLDSTGVKKTMSKIVDIGRAFRVKKASAGDTNSLLIGDDGWVYSAGSNISGQTGIGRTSGNTVSFTLVLNKPVTDISAGFDHGIAVSSTGDLYSWGNNSNYRTGQGIATGTTVVPLLVEEFGEGSVNGKVKQAGAGYYNSFALTEHGKVFSVGSNLNGSSGTQGDLISWTPLNIPGIVTDLSVSYYTAGAITSLGVVYVWGDGSYGRLGNGLTSSTVTPSRLSIPQRIKQLAMGATCGIALGIDETTLYAWGRAGSVTNESDWISPQIITIPGFDPSTDKVYSIAARRFDNNPGSIIIVTSIGVFAAGTNNYGMLGVNSTNALTTLTKITDIKTYKGTQYTDASIGNQHTFLITGENSIKPEYSYVGYGIGHAAGGRLGAMSGSQKVPVIITR